MNIVLIHNEIGVRSHVLALIQAIPELNLSNVLSNYDELEFYLTHSCKPKDVLLLGMNEESLKLYYLLVNKMVKNTIVLLVKDRSYAFKPFDLNVAGFMGESAHKLEFVQILSKVNPALPEIYPPDSEGTYKERFLVKVGDRFMAIATDEIAYFFAEGKYVYLVCEGNNRKYLIDYSMEELASRLLNPRCFHRINRKYILHIAVINQVKQYYNRRLKVYINGIGNPDMVVARERVSAFKQWMNQ